MGRRAKTGLDYFPKNVAFYDDFKIMELLDEYGPNGITIYDATLCVIYGNGYYIECPDMNQLAAKIIKMVGNRWIRKKDFVLQVIRFCADIGLFDKALLNQNVITSVGIQRRYSEVTARNKVNKEKYWLYKEDGQPLLSDVKKPISATEKAISDAEKAISATEMQQIKENKRKVNNIAAAASIQEEDEDDGMDPMEAMRIWNERNKKQ
ncbi:MAG: DUF4373 domain-containing protein [Catenibacillus sp.]|nr:DUF4373 domain-containing protein [Catenibacillus sp.]